MTAPPPRRRSRGADPVLTAAVGVVGAVTAWARLDDPTRHVVWADDGVTFLAERLRSDPWSTTFDPYAGYLHVVPRLLTDLALVVAPLRDAATTIALLACVVAGLVVAVVHLAAAGLVASPAARVVVALLPVLVPVAPLEVLGNLANLHWLFLWMTPWLLLARPRGWSATVVLAVAAALGSLSELQCALFVPLLLVGVRDRVRDPRRAVLAGSLVAGVVVQVVTTLQTPRAAPPGADLGVLDVVLGWAVDVVLPIWHASRTGVGPVLATLGWWAALLAVLPFAAVVVWGGWHVARTSCGARCDPLGTDRLLLLGALAVGATVPYAAAIWLNRAPVFRYSVSDPAELAERLPVRYGMVAAVFLLALVVCAADQAATPALVRAGVVGVVLVVCLAQLSPSSTRRTAGPAWPRQVDRVERVCTTKPEVRLRVAPTGSYVSATCLDLARAR